ncbi:MAG TPA: YceI family protein [Flavobacterium lutivivi]|nr:YceI family protein [Flavobacterium lutivivi]
MKSALILLLIFSNLTIGQKIFSTKKGNIAFEASIPGFEEVKAKSDEATCKLNIENGTFESSLLIKSLHFKLELMEEHFNENYLESNRYPKSIFKGKIMDFDKEKITEVEKEFTIKGTLELHGKIQNISITGTLKRIGKSIFFKADFYINADDFDVKIPNLISSKVSNKVLIHTNYILN